MTYGTGVGGDKSLSVSGQVSGEATLKVEAGSTLIQIVEQAQNVIKLSGQLNGNGPGSTGKSSPDANSGRSGG